MADHGRKFVKVEKRYGRTAYMCLIRLMPMNANLKSRRIFVGYESESDINGSFVR